MTRTEFWEMHPIELHWLMEVKRAPRTIGPFSEDEAEALYQTAAQAES